MNWRMDELLAEQTIKEVSDEKEPLIVCDGVVKLFKADEVEVFALQGLDITINRGEIMAIIGKSGSGKSTLLNIIGGLEKPSAGSIIVNGKNLADMNEKEMNNYRKHTVGFVWQRSSRNLFPYLTARENVEMAMNFEKMKPKAKKEKAKHLLELVGIDHKSNVYPMQMSGGEQQRVAIAVALANDPDILLADEPTGAVDTKTSNMLQALFRRLNQELGITVIIVTHDIKLADKVNRVVMISDGKISTEKVMKQQYIDQIANKAADLMFDNIPDDDTHEEYSVLDKANRVQLSKEMLEAAGINSKKVRVSIEDGKVIITE